MKSQALSTWVSEVVPSSWEVGDLLIHSLLETESLDDSSHVVSHLVVVVGRDSIVSLVVSSDRSGSVIEDKPLSVVPWLMVVNSELE